METNSDYKVPMRDHDKQSSREDKNSLQNMRRYSGVLSVFGDQQVMHLFSYKLNSYKNLVMCKTAAITVYELAFSPLSSGSR